jgi:hypothetical protein
MSRYCDSSLMSGLGRRRRTTHRRGRGILSELLGLTGLGRRRRRRTYHRRRRRVHRRRYHRRRIGVGRRRYHRRGRGILDVLKKGISYAAPIIGSAVLGKAGSAIGSRIFGGRRHHKVHHRRRMGGIMHRHRRGRGILL